MGHEGIPKGTLMLASTQAEPAVSTKPPADLHSVAKAKIAMTFAEAAAFHRGEVLRALQEEGTTNTDFLLREGPDGQMHRNIGTHKLRPLAFLGGSVIEEQIAATARLSNSLVDDDRALDGKQTAANCVNADSDSREAA